MSTIKLPGNPLAKIRRRLYYEDGRIVHHTQQDVKEITDLAKYRYNETDGHSIPEGNYGVHVAYIPTTIYYDIIRKARTEAERDELLRRWLNDPDNRAFRSWKGRI